MIPAGEAEPLSLPPAPDAPAASLIIPLRASPAVFEWEERLTRLLSAIPADCFEILIVDYGTREEWRPGLDAVVRSSAAPARIVRVESADLPFSIGRARDIGVVAASAPVVLFNDVDFLAPRAVYEAIAAEILARRLSEYFDRFFCVPVIFLTAEATRDYLRADGETDLALGHAAFRDRGLDEASGTSVFIAYASSCMVANRAHYLAIGGHDQSFWGHGAEDFELMHRMFAELRNVPRPPFYYVDFKDNGVKAYRGFRAAFATFGIEAFQRGLFLVHLHHPSRPDRSYNQRRRRNFRRLRERMQAFDRTGTHPPPLPDPRRGNTPEPALLRSEASMLPLDSPIFAPFGGAAAIEQALRQAAQGGIEGQQNLLRRSPYAWLALNAYRLGVGWRLPRRERILLKHAPAEFLGRRESKAADLLLRLLQSER